MTERQKCDICHKWYRRLEQHKLEAHGIEPGGDNPGNGDDPPPVTQEMLQQVLSKAAAEAAVQAVNASKEELKGEMPGLIRNILKQELDQMAAKYAAAQAQAAENQAPPTQLGQTPPAGGRPGMGEILQLMTAWQQMQSGGAGGLGNLENLAKQMGNLQQLGNILNQPFRDGMRLMADMFSASVRAGASPETAAEAARKTVDALDPKPPQTPPQQT